MRPDSDADGCDCWTPGQPGTGTLHQQLKPGTAERYVVRVSAGLPMGAPVRLVTFKGCDGDGHYECRRCIFFRSRATDGFEGGFSDGRYRRPLICRDDTIIRHPRSM